MHRHYRLMALGTSADIVDILSQRKARVVSATRAVIVAGAVIASAACSGGKGSPSAPTPQPNQPSQPGTFTLNGTLMSTNGGTPLTASMNFGIASTTATNG